MNKQLRGIGCLLLATVIWGGAFVAQSVGMDLIGPFTFQAVRCFMAVVGLLVVILITDPFKKDGKTFYSRWADPKLWKAGILCGIPLFLACNLQQVALVDTDAGKSAFLTAMYIVIVPVISLFLGKKFSIMIPLSVAMGVLGLYFLSCIGVDRIMPGDIYLLGCALMFAVQITIVDKYASFVDGIRLNLIQSLVCAILSTVIMFFIEKPDMKNIVDCWMPLSYAGFLSMGAAYALQIYGQRDVESNAASLLMSLESVFAVIFGALLLKERMTQWETIGCILVFGAVIISQLPPPKRKAQKIPEA